MNDGEHIAEVRGVPVRFECSRWSVTAHATQRGYFPVSSTGFRSLSGCAPEASALAELADNFDEEREVALSEAERALAAQPPAAPSVFVFLRQYGAATFAADAGLFAPDADRRALWAAALAICRRIDAEPRFHPVPGPDVSDAWDESHCAHWLATARALRDFLAAAATGQLLAPAKDGRPFGYSTYCELAPREEPTFEAGAYASPLDLFPDEREPEEDPADDDEEPDDLADPLTPATEAPEPDAVQLALF